MISVDKQQKDAQEVINLLQEKADNGELHQVFCVYFTGDVFNFTCSGNWHNLAVSSSVLQSEFKNYMDGL